MKFIPQVFPEVILIEPTLNNDERGYFMESFKKDSLSKAIGYNIDFVQENESKSSRGVLRGLHYQAAPYSQAKLLRVLSGKIFDVVLDIRRSSKTFGHYLSIKLDAKNKQQLFIPCGFAHGFVTISDNATVSYKVDNYYSAEHDRGILFDDKELSIKWGFPKEHLLLSKKDKKNPLLKDAKDLF